MKKSGVWGPKSEVGKQKAGPEFLTSDLRLRTSDLSLRRELQFDLFGLEGDDGNSEPVGQFDDIGLVEHDGQLAFDGQHAGAGFAHRLDRLDADGGDVETHVLLRLGDFDDGEAAAAAQAAGPSNRRVGPFDSLQRD